MKAREFFCGGAAISLNLIGKIELGESCNEEKGNSSASRLKSRDKNDLCAA